MANIKYCIVCKKTDEQHHPEDWGSCEMQGCFFKGFPGFGSRFDYGTTERGVFRIFVCDDCLEANQHIIDSVKVEVVETKTYSVCSWSDREKQLKEEYDARIKEYDLTEDDTDLSSE